MTNLPLRCPTCRSSAYHKRLPVEVVAKEVWNRDGPLSEQPVLQKWPCMDDWHGEGMSRQFMALPREEQDRIRKECEEFLEELNPAGDEE